MLIAENQDLGEGTWEEGFPAMLVYLDYTFLPLRTFLDVHNIILETHDYLIDLFELDKEQIFEWYQFEIKELQTGNSSVIKLEFNFHFPEKTKKNSRLLKAIKRFAFVASLFSAIIGAQEIYLNSLEIKNEKTKLERSIPHKTMSEGKKLDINIQKLQEPETQRYITSVKKRLADAVAGKNILSFQINGEEIKTKRKRPVSGSFDL